VRDFFIHNAVYWLEEYHFDGLRLDAVHAIQDDSTPDILMELATTVRRTFCSKRYSHLILENDDNAAHYLNRISGTSAYDAQWNDDIHHVCHVLTSGESDGYYSDYADRPAKLLGKCLTEGFLFQGQASAYRNGKHRGEPSRDLPPSSFVNFLQNHDQVGNRAFGERISSYARPDAVKAVMAILLLAPSPPLLFMGEEFAASTPFLFFCDFEGDLAKAVRDGRRAEFAKFRQFRDAATRDRIPDPNAEGTFLASKLDWDSQKKSQHMEWLNFYSHLLALRKREIVPLLREIGGNSRKTSYTSSQANGLNACWHLDNKTLKLQANLSDDISSFEPSGRGLIYSTFAINQTGGMPPWSVAWFVNQ